VKQIYKIRFAFLLCFGDNGFLDTMVMLLGADKSDVPRQKKKSQDVLLKGYPQKKERI
jgi:hypothetical protein